MKDASYRIIGLLGFVVAGVLFVIVGLRSGDMLTVAASVIWTLSCVVWLIPLVRSGR